MVDISDAKIKQMLGKPWSAWNLPGCSTDLDSVKLREVHKPKVPDKPKDHSNLLPQALKQLYGTKPETEYFSVIKCPACKCVMKSQWMSTHFKRDACNSLVCRRTEMIVNGSRCLGKATTPLYDIKEATKDPFEQFSSIPTAPIITPTPTTTIAKVPLNNPSLDDIPPFEELSPPSPPRQKHVSHKSEHFSSSHNSSHTLSKSKSSSKSDSHSKKHSSSSHSKHKSSSKSGVSSSSWSSSSSKKDSSKSHKPNASLASYVLSIPSQDDSHNDLVESLLMSKPMHITSLSSKHKSSEPEFEQLKFYADSSDKRKSSTESDSKSFKSHFSSHLENFKIPLKSKSSSGGGGSSSEVSKKSKSSHSHSSKSSHESSKTTHRHSSGSSKPIPSLTIISEGPKKDTPIITHIMPEIKSSHSKKKKKKKDRDEPRKIIPLKERAFNPDQHCGVVVHEDGPCTRSLTCKTHSVASRRAVPGRSDTFDTLLAAHKKARDEEKAKSKEVIEESKSKGKKASVSVPLPVDSDSSSNSFLQPASVGKVNASSTSTSGKTLGPTVTLATASMTAQSSNGRHTNNSSGSKSGHSQSSTQHRNLSKAPPAAKALNRPMIIVDEKKEVQGMSMFELTKEPENNYTYVCSMEAPKLFGNIKDLDGKNSRNNALSEWNPLDRISTKKKSTTSKRKKTKAPFVPLVPYKVGGVETSFGFREATTVIGRKETATSISTEAVLNPTDLKSSMAASTTKKKKALKRKSSSKPLDPGSPKFRLLSGPHKFYESLIFNKSTQKKGDSKSSKVAADSSTQEKLRTLETAPTEENSIVLKTAIDMIKTHLNDIGYSSKESIVEHDTAKLFNDSLNPGARAFIRNYVKANSDNKESADKLSPEEICQHAFELANRCILS